LKSFLGISKKRFPQCWSYILIIKRNLSDLSRVPYKKKKIIKKDILSTANSFLFREVAKQTNMWPKNKFKRWLILNLKKFEHFMVTMIIPFQKWDKYSPSKIKERLWRNLYLEMAKFHRKHMEFTEIDTLAMWAKKATHGWEYGWKLEENNSINRCFEFGSKIWTNRDYLYMLEKIQKEIQSSETQGRKKIYRAYLRKLEKKWNENEDDLNLEKFSEAIVKKKKMVKIAEKPIGPRNSSETWIMEKL